MLQTRSAHRLSSQHLAAVPTLNITELVPAVFFCPRPCFLLASSAGVFVAFWFLYLFSSQIRNWSSCGIIFFTERGLGRREGKNEGVGGGERRHLISFAPLLRILFRFRSSRLSLLSPVAITVEFIHRIRAFPLFLL